MALQVVKTLPAERFTPYTLAKKLGAVALLESSSFTKGRERFSILMVKKAFDVLQLDGTIKIQRNDKLLNVKSDAADILDVLLYFANQHSGFETEYPFPAGGIGYLSYEFSKYCDDIVIHPQTDTLALPEAHYLIGNVFIIFDHYTDQMHIVGINYKEHSVDLDDEIAQIIKRINDMDFNYLNESDGSKHAEVVSDPSREEQYMNGVEEIRKEIIKGNLLQGVLSRRVELEIDLASMDAYRKLRSSNPSPYLFHIDFGRYQLFGASPEVHVRVKHGKGILRPIAGTRKRGLSYNEDIALEKDLLSDEKELAEHLMLIDLARNDLGRICDPGTVKVTDYMTIERYSHVMHIVSEVQGQLKEGMNGLHAVRATFPAGTVSGAPKIKAIEILSRLESEKRTFYAGIVGYMEPGGDLDTCIAIRTGLKVGRRLVLQAGAGIVYDSKPERELEETKEKLGALMAAFGLEV